MANWPDLCAAAYLGTTALETAWAAINPPARTLIGQNDWAVLKNIAMTTAQSNAVL